MADQPTEEEFLAWHRRLGAQANNRAWTLSEQGSRSAADDEEMLHAAHASFHHWSKVGIALNVARGRMLLGHVCALLGDGKAAINHATAAFQFVMAHESEPWEVAFAHAVLANAACAAGDQALHRSHYAQAAQLGAALADAEDRKIFEATFKVVPYPQ